MEATPIPLSETLFRLFATWQFGWGLLAFFAISRDKQLAAEGRTRIPERKLHEYELWGGWAGSFIAQQVFRHKTRKVAYQREFRLIALAWIAAWAVILALRFYLDF